MDYELMFEKIIYSAIERFYDNVDWGIQNLVAQYRQIYSIYLVDF